MIPIPDPGGEIMNTTIMVTESTGPLEKEIIKQIHKTGNCVKIAAIDTTEASLTAGECPVAFLDLADPGTYQRALIDVKSVFLGLPMNHPGLQDLLLPFIETARIYGVEHIVGMGTMGETDDSPLLIAERCMQNCGISYTIIRPNIYMQHFREITCEGVRRDSTIYLPAGGAKISLVDFRDIAEAVAKILLNGQHSNRIYFFTGAQALDPYAIAAILSTITGKKIIYEPVNHNREWKILLGRGWKAVDIELAIGLYEIARHGWCERVSTDLEKVLGREPVLFEQFARDFRDEWC